jgi:hypothetical protein
MDPPMTMSDSSTALAGAPATTSWLFGVVPDGLVIGVGTAKSAGSIPLGWLL